MQDTLFQIGSNGALFFALAFFGSLLFIPARHFINQKMAAESEAKTEAPTDNSTKDKETLIAEAEAAKDKANIAFKAKHYQAAINGYTEAINLNPTNPIYYGNRSFAHIKLENYGVALADADKATELDPKYIKGYYRRGDAHFAMGKYKLALKDLRTAAKVAPNDPDLRKKLAECEKEVKRLRFEEALAGPATATITSTINLSDMTVEDSYTGPRMEGSDSEGYRVTEKFVLDMIEAFRDQKKIHRRFAFEIILQTQNILKALPSLVDVVIPDDRHFTVCGDVHGQFYDLLNVFKLNENPSKDNPYLFNGDFVDRGSFSVEVILTLFAWKVMDPSCMHLTRGNHESKSMNMIYGFEGEVKAKYSGVMAEVFRETFCWLPLAYCLNGRVLVLHGGLFSKDDVTLDDIRKCDRNMEPPEAGLMCEALWSDPCDAPGLSMSKRGVGTQFGSDITKDFLDRNGLDLVVRSHEVKEEGYEVTHDGRLVTVFSAPNYCDQMGNRGAFVRFEGKDMKPQFTKFSAVPHPNVKPMAFASGMFRGM